VLYQVGCKDERTVQNNDDMGLAVGIVLIYLVSKLLNTVLNGIGRNKRNEDFVLNR
jgi:hypothetical protein